MKTLKMYFYMPTMALAFFMLISCSNNTAKVDESKVGTMDSVSKDLDETTKQLDEQATKVEVSLEKLDK